MLKQKKSGRKRPRVNDLDVQPAPDVREQKDDLDPFDSLQVVDVDEPSNTNVKDERGNFI